LRKPLNLAQSRQATKRVNFSVRLLGVFAALRETLNFAGAKGRVDTHPARASGFVKVEL
jgi:hypothetical protein